MALSINGGRKLQVRNAENDIGSLGVVGPERRQNLASVHRRVSQTLLGFVAHY